MKIIVLSICFFANVAYGEILTASEINQLIKPYMEANKFVGMAVAVVGPQGETVAFYGETKKDNSTPPNIDSLFEIASVTKAITGTLLAGFILENRVHLSDLAQNHLAKVILSKNNALISVEQLATHRSGIKPIPDPLIFQPADSKNPWMGFGENELFKLLPQMDLNFIPGTKNEYSNLGAAVLGYVLEAIDGRSYEEILKDKIILPLSLASTSITLTSSQRQKLVSGYFNDGQGNLTPIAKWDLSGVPAAGAICSNLHDMISLSKGLMNDTTPLGKAFVLASQKRYETNMPGNAIGLFWNINNSQNFVWHNGATYGQSSFLAIHPQKKFSVVVLTNTFNLTQDETKLGFQIMKKASEKF